MNHKFNLAFFFIFTAISNLADAAIKLNAMGWSIPGSYTCEPIQTNMIQLMGNPSVFSGRTVRVIGVLSMGEESHRLYLNREFHAEGIRQYSVDLEIPSEAYAASKKTMGNMC